MAYPRYPDWMPLPQAGKFSGKTQTFITRTTMASGRPRNRRLGVGTYMQATLNFTLDPGEYEYFLSWWEGVIQAGALPFFITMSTGFQGVAGDYLMQASDELSFSSEGWPWSISLPVTILQRPKMTDEQMAMADLMRSTVTEGFSEAEASFNELMNTTLPNHLD